MKLSYFPNQTALGSEPIWRAFLQGCQKLGIELVENSMTADAAVIWSVLWYGRMMSNKHVYDTYRKQGKPVFVIEVGTLKRGKTWKISLNNINRLAAWGNEKYLDLARPAMLGLDLQQTGNLRPEFILVAAQHKHSLQWEGMPDTRTWVSGIIETLRKHTDRPIVVRPHPRNRFSLPNLNNVRYELAQPIQGTYSEHNISYDCHCVINHNSGPGIQSIIAGTPVICDQSSLAYPMSTRYEYIENPQIPDREEWFTQICHTEWLVEEIAQGIPQARLLSK
jgi:hypothetical protein